MRDLLRRREKSFRGAEEPPGPPPWEREKDPEGWSSENFHVGVGHLKLLLRQGNWKVQGWGMASEET